jgi:hypothetical protein
MIRSVILVVGLVSLVAKSEAFAPTVFGRTNSVVNLKATVQQSELVPPALDVASETQDIYSHHVQTTYG